jgi:outer membrane protein OmpA-like peptidoglycan-associated protein|tara:strand:- start:483 stop:2027 length:1545 start_codon:yes stop_codon:yes gene_type:complete
MVIKGFLDMYLIRLLFLFVFLNPSFLMAQEEPIIFYGDSEQVPQINSPADESALLLSENSSLLIYSRTHNRSISSSAFMPTDIWVAEGASNRILDLDSKSIHTAVGFLNQKQSFVYASLREQGGGYQTQLMIADWLEGNLGNPRGFEIKYFKNKSAYFSAAFSPDGKHMVMSMEANVTMGVEDLYVSHVQKNGEWSPPMTLGYGINTRAQEVTPFLAHDNETLFFATNGREGLGSFDIYYAKRLDNTWQKWSDPINLGSKINTSGAEKSFSFLDETAVAYYTSNTKSDGYGDIRSIRIGSDLKYVKDTLAQSQIPEVELSQKIVLVLNAENEKMVAGVFDIKTDSLSLRVENPFIWKASRFSDLELSINIDGFMNASQLLPSSEWSDLDTIKVFVDPLTPGNNIKLKEVLFYKGTDKMIEGSTRSLDLLVNVLKSNASLKIELRGHTDNLGNPALNQTLSEDRVEVVEKYLIKAGIAPNRLSGKGLGGSQPLAKDSSEAARRLNRRVEFLVIEN